MPKAVDLTGQTFGRLTAVAPTVNRSRCGSVIWICRCACGSNTEVRGRHLKSGNTMSCGCLNAEATLTRATKHGLSKTPEYRVWAYMIQRCHNPNHQSFPYYGGRGISVCPEWQDGFEPFYAHAGPRPSPKHTLDRYPDNDGDYTPGNVRWATRKEQAANKRNNGPATSLGLKRYHREHPEAARARGPAISAALQRRKEARCPAY
jgi:hypothetical protein